MLVSFSVSFRQPYQVALPSSGSQWLWLCSCLRSSVLHRRPFLFDYVTPHGVRMMLPKDGMKQERAILWGPLGEVCTGCLYAADFERRDRCPVHGLRRVILTVECEPELGKVDAPDAYPSFLDYVGFAWRKAGNPLFHHGSIGVEIHVYWGQPRHLDFITGDGDVDALDKAVLDALGGSEKALCELLDDDNRVTRFVTAKYYDKKNPRVEIGIWRRDG